MDSIKVSNSLGLALFLCLPFLVASTSYLLPPACTVEPEYGRCDGIHIRYFFNQTTGHCGHFQYSGCGGNGEIFESHTDCLHECSCGLPADVGQCRALVSRYHYDPLLGRCRPFGYGGCGGNENNFMTESECTHQCVCTRPKTTGLCSTGFPSFYFDVTENRCKSTDGGCADNINRFGTMKDCNDRCVCNMDTESGMCRAYFPKVYYNATNNQCKEFVYGGCGGNGNRFGDVETCQQTCATGA